MVHEVGEEWDVQAAQIDPSLGLGAGLSGSGLVIVIIVCC